MGRISCSGGRTQISRALGHARAEHAKRRINAMIYVGDAIEEDVDDLADKAGQLGMLGLPMFIFQEGNDARVEAAFRDFARLSKGRLCPGSTRRRPESWPPCSRPWPPMPAVAGI